MSVAVQPAPVLGGAELSAALRFGIHRLISREEVINKINVFPVPDGDTGTTLAITLQAVLAALDASPEAQASVVLTRVADAALDGAAAGGDDREARVAPARQRRRCRRARLRRAGCGHGGLPRDRHRAGRARPGPDRHAGGRSGGRGR